MNLHNIVIEIFISFNSLFQDYIRTILQIAIEVGEDVNSQLKNYEPIHVAGICILGTYIAAWLITNLYGSPEPLSERLVRGFFDFVRKLPFVQGAVQKQLQKAQDDLEISVAEKDDSSIPVTETLPTKGLKPDKVLAMCEHYSQMAKPIWTEGFCSGTVYVDNAELTELMTNVYHRFAWTNPLHADIFPDVRRMEAEIVRMTCAIFNGDENSCGTMSSGGTESILLACRAYRDRAWSLGIKYPEMLVPESAHAAFDKAAQYFQIRLTKIPLVKDTFQVDVRKMRKYINSNVCMLVASAPQFAQGIVDPVAKVAKLGESYGIPVHVDCCLGGFVLPFMEKAGVPLNEQFDFRLPGVTSISCDTHKYGFAPKGSSVILYRNREYRQFQFFTQPNWSGGIYATPTIAGSRPGAIIAVCWASLMYYGESGYIETAGKIVKTTRYIAAKAREIPGVDVMGDPLVNVVAFGSKAVNIYYVSDRMLKRNWHLSPLQFPFCVHLCVTQIHTKPGVADRLLKDLSEVVAELLAEGHNNTECASAIYGTSQSIPDRSIVSEIAGHYISSCYNTKFPAYERMKQQKSSAAATANSS